MRQRNNIGQGRDSSRATVRENAMAKSKPKPITTDKLVEDLHTVVRDAEELLKVTASQAGEKVQEARERAQESLRGAKERLSELEDDALERARAFANDAEAYVREKPWNAVAVAAGIGLVLGLLIGRR
jgi:ElaB/YqjD/DUF883 family membrane-anchored ribosome-binding protein